jgi:hypothetical protein
MPFLLGNPLRGTPLFRYYPSQTRPLQPGQEYDISGNIYTPPSRPASAPFGGGIPGVNMTPAYQTPNIPGTAPGAAQYMRGAPTARTRAPAFTGTRPSRATARPTFTPGTVRSAATESVPTTEPSADQEIEGLFQEIEGLLGQAGGYIGSPEEAVSRATRPYDAYLPLLEQARSEAETANVQQQGAERTREQSALGEARRLYSELQQGLRQQFGASTSAGEFAGGLQGRELQRSQARISGTASENLRALSQQSNDIRNRYYAERQGIEQQKAAAQAKANDEYNQRLLAINNARIQNAQYKAQLKADLLREHRERSMAIQDQARSFSQQLQSSVVQADLNLRNAIAAYRAESNKPLDLANLPGANFSTPLGAQQSAVPQTPTGFFRRREDEFGEAPVPTGYVRLEDGSIVPESYFQEQALGFGTP